jgi:RNA polymerase sigma factor (sigma-70 family)
MALRPSKLPVLVGKRNLRGPSVVEEAVVGRPLGEEELVARAKRGDAAAYEQLVEQNQNIAFRTAYVITGSAADAEDAAQDAFIKAYYALGRFRSGAPLRPWLLRIVANEARNRRRSGGRRANLALRAATESPSGGAAPPPEAALLRAEQRSELLEAVNRLREEHRQVIACRYFLDLSEEEIASTLGWRRGTVKSRLSRALAQLREEVGAGD